MFHPVLMILPHRFHHHHHHHLPGKSFRFCTFSYLDFMRIIWKIFGSIFTLYSDCLWIFGYIFSIYGIYADNVWSMHIMHIMYRLTTPFLNMVWAADPQMFFVIFLFTGFNAVSFCLAFLFLLSSSLCHFSFSSCSHKACRVSRLPTSTSSSA